MESGSNLGSLGGDSNHMAPRKRLWMDKDEKCARKKRIVAA